MYGRFIYLALCILLCVNCDSLLQMLVCGISAGSQSGVCLPMLNGIRCDDIDNLVGRFPPCMRHLHNCLRQKHRLRHMSRVRTTNIHEARARTLKLAYC